MVQHSTLGIMAMFTSSEFVKKLRVCKTQQAWIILGIAVASGLVLPAAMHRATFYAKIFFLVCWMILMLSVGQFASAFIFRRHGFVCSSCKRPLETLRIVETGKCPHCKTEVIRDA